MATSESLATSHGLVKCLAGPAARVIHGTAHSAHRRRRRPGSWMACIGVTLELSIAVKNPGAELLIRRVRQRPDHRDRLQVALPQAASTP